MTEREFCGLQHAVGQVEPCPGPHCPLWVVDRNRSGCVLEAVEREIASSPTLARYLLELKLVLERTRASKEDTPARTLFYRLLNDELAAEA